MKKYTVLLNEGEYTVTAQNIAEAKRLGSLNVRIENDTRLRNAKGATPTRLKVEGVRLCREEVGNG